RAAGAARAPSAAPRRCRAAAAPGRGTARAAAPGGSAPRGRRWRSRDARARWSSAFLDRRGLAHHRDAQRTLVELAQQIVDQVRRLRHRAGNEDQPHLVAVLLDAHLFPEVRMRKSARAHRLTLPPDVTLYSDADR